jgi:uncharacterized XkdX family phage protein
MEHNKMYEKLKTRYEKNYCTKEQLKRYASLGAITAEEYEEITGEALETETGE